MFVFIMYQLHCLLLFRCYNKYLELDRSSVQTSDYQRVKLTELDEVMQSDEQLSNLNGSSGGSGNGVSDRTMAAVAFAATRVPRTLEVEMRDTLVNTCVAGDLLCIVGIVKTVQVCYCFGFIFFVMVRTG
jgi:hypothetical protein